MKKKRASIFLYLSIAIAALCLTGCNDPSATVTQKTFLIELTVGEEAYIRTEDESIWKSDGVSVTIEQTGRGHIRIYGASEGVARVTGGNKTYLVSVSAASDVFFMPEQSVLIIDANENLYAPIIVSGRRADEFTYSVDNPDIASVDADGVVRGRRNGVTAVTVTEKRSNLSKNVQVGVYGVTAAAHTVSYDTGAISAGGHVQGVDADRYGDYFYYSFMDRLVKQDNEGRIVGSVTGFDGHLGDVAYNKQDGKVYSTLTSDTEKKCYIAVFNPDAITRMNMTPAEVCTFVYVGAPVAALAATNGYELTDEWLATGGKYGVTNSIDSCTFGPKFGADDGKYYLTLGLGAAAKATKITVNGAQKGAVDRTDNDYLVIVQFDVSDWGDFASSILAEAGGPESFDGMYFHYYGYHDYGIQNICYDAYQDIYFMAAYDGSKGAATTPYSFYALDAKAVEEKTLVGNGEETGAVISSKYGLSAGNYDKGYAYFCSVGFVSMHDGSYYMCDVSYTNYNEQKHGAKLDLYEWGLTALNQTTATCPVKKVEN